MTPGILHYKCEACEHEWEIPTRDVHTAWHMTCNNIECDSFRGLKSVHITLRPDWKIADNGDVVDSEGTVVISSPVDEISAVFGVVVETTAGPVQLTEHEGVIISSKMLDKGTIVVRDPETGYVTPAKILQNQISAISDEFKGLPMSAENRDHLMRRVDEAISSGINRSIKSVDFAVICDARNNDQSTIDNHMLNLSVWLFEPVPYRAPGSYRGVCFMRDMRAGNVPKMFTLEDPSLIYLQSIAHKYSTSGASVIFQQTDNGFKVVVIANDGIDEWTKRHPNNLGTPEYWEFIEHLINDPVEMHGYQTAANEAATWAVNEVLPIFKKRFNRWPELKEVVSKTSIEIEFE